MKPFDYARVANSEGPANVEDEEKAQKNDRLILSARVLLFATVFSSLLSFVLGLRLWMVTSSTSLCPGSAYATDLGK